MPVIYTNIRSESSTEMLTDHEKFGLLCLGTASCILNLDCCVGVKHLLDFISLPGRTRLLIYHSIVGPNIRSRSEFQNWSSGIR